MRAVLSRFRLSYQIALLGFVGLIGVLTVAGINWWGAAQLAQSNAVADHMRQMQAMETSIQIKLLQARREEKNFLLRRDETSIEKQHAAIEAALRDGQALAALAADQPDLAASVGRMLTDIPLYSDRFSAVVRRSRTIGLNENLGLQGALRGAVHSVEDALKSVAVPNAQIAMLMMRRNEKDFIVRLDPQYGAAVKAQLDSFIAAIDAARLPADLTRDLATKMAAYQDAFARFVTETLTLQTEIKALTTLSNEIEPRLVAADQQFATRAAAADQASESVRVATNHLVTWSALIVIGVMLALSWLIGRSIARPIAGVTHCMEALTRGDLEVQMPRDDRRDEIGTMIRVVQAFKESLVESARLRREQETSRLRAESERNAALVEMAEKIESEAKDAMREVSHRTTVMAESAGSMTSSAARTGASAESAAAAAGQALANAQTVASAAEQLTASIREIGGQVNRSNTVVSQAVEAGRATRQKMETMNDQVGRIGAVADMISEIAAKTNLLALNATIEAARAGDAGKGFAVVASEVKQLATQTARSTEEIGRHIAEVRTATGASVSAVAHIEETIEEINAIAGSIAAAVEQQGAATTEIARNVAETAAAANLMTERISEVSVEAVQTGQHAAEVRDNSAGLDTAVNDLQHAVIRVVRTSTNVVDRRHCRRRPCLVEATITCDGQTGTASIHDISEHGCVASTTLHCQRGSHIEIGLSGFGIRLSGHVTEQIDRDVHVEFGGEGLQPAEADRVSLTTIAEMVKLTKDDHVAFVKRVADAVTAGEKLPPENLATHHNCRLGRWYSAISDTATLKLPSFGSMSEPHHGVHDAGRKALAAVIAGDAASAQKYVREMRGHSERVLQCLDQFGREYPATITQQRDRPEMAVAA